MDLTKLLEWSTSRERNIRIINSFLNDIPELEVTQIHSLCNLFHWDATLFDKVVDFLRICWCFSLICRFLDSLFDSLDDLFDETYDLT